MSENQSEFATFAGGCFWGMEEILRKLPGVLSTEVGYTGGMTESPVYEQVKTGKTGHTESIQLEFDPSQITYDALLDCFFKMHDPTTLNRQGGDIGSQYRSVIFYHSVEQEESAKRARDAVNESGKWKAPVVTEILPASRFYTAEKEHQSYLQRNPGGYTCHWLRD